MGRLTRDPELKFTTNGKALVLFSVATSERRKNKQTEQWEDVNPTFFNCKAWEQIAENIAESLVRGDEVIVVGKLYQESYTGRDGASKTSHQNMMVEAAGPNLRWATARAQRAQRGDTQPAQQQPVADPWATVPAGGDPEPPF